MRKQLLFLSLAGLVLSVSAGENKSLSKPLKPATAPVKVLNYNAPKSNLSNASAARSGRALVKFPIGSSGNLNSVLISGCNQLYADDSINSVTFIHRNDETAACCNTPGNNVGQYRFGISKDGGTNWITNIGVLNPSAENVLLNGRYPQGVIYRPTGVTVADSAYLGYAGTWHNGSNGSWYGEYRGAAQLSGDPATFREHPDTVNGGKVLTGNSFTVAGDKFFNMNEENLGDFATYSTTPVTALIMQRGVWNNATKNVDWTDTRMPMNFEAQADGSSILTNDVIAFDPSGQYGWLIGTGDITPADNEYRLAPFYMKSTDFGATWSSPVQINIDTLAGYQMPILVDQNTGDTVKTTIRISGTIDLVVDHLGNPHIFNIGYLAPLDNDAYDTYYPFYGYKLYDLTIGANQCQSGWIANFLKDIYATASQFAIVDDANAAYTDNNRLQASRTMDGKHIFAIWSETDSALAAAQGAGNADNVSPDLLGIGIDLVGQKTTAVKNFTTGDAMFSGESTGVAQGTVGGAIFSSVSQTAFTKGTTYNVPAILTEPDYNNPTANPKSGINPAKYYYCKNIDFASSEFSLSLDKLSPVIDVAVANDTIIIHKDSTFTIPSATAFDCVDGNVTVFTSSNVTTTTTGSYAVTYVATDNAGNKDSITLIVLVQAKPIALFASTKITGNKYIFNDTSLNSPTSRLWTFNNLNPTAQNPVNKTFTANGSMNVCLKVSNYYGTDSICKPFQIALGIQDEEMTKSISVFPTTSNGLFTFNLSKTFTDNIAVTAYSLNGEKVSEEKTIKSNTATTTLDFTTLASGLYQLKIGNAKDGYTVKPVIINK
jgi:PKD repeat protein